MPKFHYQAVDVCGAAQNGVLEAPSKKAAIESLSAKQLWIIRVEDRKDSPLFRDIQITGPRMKLEEMTLFCRELATLVRAGITITEAVTVLGEQAKKKHTKQVLYQIVKDVESGTPLSQAASKTPTMFNKIFVHLVEAGEISGQLDDMLERLAVYYEKEHNTREKIKSAMIYPVIMLIMTAVVVTILMMFVIPNLITSFTMIDVELPLPTRVVIAVSDWFQLYPYIPIGLILGIPILLSALLKIPAWRYRFDYMKLYLPVFGKLNQKQALARFSRTFTSLFSAAIPITEVLTIVSRVTGNEVYGTYIRKARDTIKDGKPLHEAFKNDKLFPPMLQQMMSVGERSGNLDSMLETLAGFYEADVDRTADRLKQMLEPIMIVILAVIVGFIVLSVMLPSFTIMDNMG